LIRKTIGILICVFLSACGTTEERPAVFSGNRPIVLRYFPEEGPRPEAVYLVGSFNGWVMMDPDFRMRWDAATSSFFFEFTIEKRGLYQFKFIVNGTWVDPPVGPTAPDPLGGRMGIFVVE
jgi:hypothetical protein